MIYGYKYEPLLIRVPTWIDRRYEIQGYDADNLYPQRAKEAKNRSYTAKIACARYAEFLNGEGFTDQKLASLVINRKGHTANDFLDHVCNSASWANGFFFHIGYNLNYKINSVKVLDFEFNRFGLPDDDGNFDLIKYSTNWERNPYKNLTAAIEISDYHVFNPDPAVVAKEMECAGGIMNYKGQIFYWTPEEGQYPKATFDTVFDQAQTQAEIGIFDLAMEQNGFTARHAIFYPSKFETKKEEQDFKDGVNSFQGQGGGGALIIENPDGTLKASDMITSLQMQNTGDLHVSVDKRVRDAIRVAFGMPAEIIGELPETGMFNKQQLEDAYIYYNSVTRSMRNMISRQMKRVFDHWYMPITQDFSIVEQQYTLDSSKKTNALGDDQVISQEQATAQSQLKGSVGGVQGILQIQDSVSKGITGYESGVAMLVEIYGFKQDVARKMLGNPKPTIANG